MAGLLAATLPLTAAGVGLGEITQQSSLGQSLRVVVPVTVGPDEDVPAECFKLIGAEREGDGVPQLLFGRVNVERTPAGTRLVVTNGRPVNDPIVRITLQAGCESAVRREYMLFLDPPAIEVPVVAAESAPPPPVVAAQPTPPPREARRAARPQARAPASAATRSTTATIAPASGTEAARKAAPPPKGRAVAKAPPSRPPAAASERPRFSVSSGAPLTGSAATEADRERARQERANAIEAETQVLRQRIVELTAMVERMQQELRAQEAAEKAAPDAGKSGTSTTDVPATPAAAVATPPDATKAEAAVAKAESPAAATPPPTAPVDSWWDDNAPLLAVILGLLLLTTAGLLWKRKRDAAQDEQWRTAEAAPIRVGPRTESPTSVLRNPSAGITLAHPETIAPAGATDIDMTSTRDAADALAVSELSHVTEEARVFMALGPNDRAIEVLHDHIRRLPRATPAAWLMLLDLYHASGKRPEFRKLADDFHAQFNVQAPLWEAFATHRSESGGLEGFPHIEQQVVELWRKPGCRAYLERLLHDNREGRRTGFPLSTYADILLLLQVLDVPADVDIDGDLAAAGKFDPKPQATRSAAAAPARPRKPMPPEPSASRPTQQAIRFELEPPNTRAPKKS